MYFDFFIHVTGTHRTFLSPVLTEYLLCVRQWVAPDLRDVKQIRKLQAHICSVIINVKRTMKQGRGTSENEGACVPMCRVCT